MFQIRGVLIASQCVAVPDVPNWGGCVNCGHPWIRKGSDLIVTRAQGKQDPEKHIQALPTVALAIDASYGTINRTPTFCRI